jgi:hypothetical protein
MKISKTLLLAGAAFIIAGGLVFGILNGIYKRKITKIEESYTAQIYEVNSRAVAAEAHADSVDFIIALYERSIDSINEVKRWYKWDRDRLEGELIDAWNEIFDAGIDANYDWLHARYPTEDSLKFPFSGEQVQYIALDLVKLDFKDSVIHNHLRLEQVLRIQIEKNADIIDLLGGERERLEFENSQLLNELAAKIEELGESAEENAMLRKRVRKIGAGGTGVAIGLVALLFLL